MLLSVICWVKERHPCTLLLSSSNHVSRLCGDREQVSDLPVLTSGFIKASSSLNPKMTGRHDLVAALSVGRWPFPQNVVECGVKSKGFRVECR